MSSRLAWKETALRAPLPPVPSSPLKSTETQHKGNSTLLGERVAQQAAAPFKTGSFRLFILKSTDHHQKKNENRTKQMGNATKEKRVQPRPKNPELWVDVSLCLHGAGARTRTASRRVARGGFLYVNRWTMTALSRLASFRVWFSSVSSLFGKVVIRTKLVAAIAGRASTMKSRMSRILCRGIKHRRAILLLSIPENCTTKA